MAIYKRGQGVELRAMLPMCPAPMTGQLSSLAHRVYDKGGKRHTLGMGEWSVQGHNADA